MGGRRLAQQKLAQAMARAQLILLRGFPGPYQIPQRLMRRVRHPDRRQVAGAITPRQLQRVAPIRFHAIARLHGHQGGRHHLACHPECRQLPIHHIPGRARLVAHSQLLGRPQLFHQPSDRLRSVRNHAHRPHLTVRFRHRHGNRFRMDIETDKSYLAHDRLLRMWLCVVQCSNSQRNPRAANRSRSFHSD